MNIRTIKNEAIYYCNIMNDIFYVLFSRERRKNEMSNYYKMWHFAWIDLRHPDIKTKRSNQY